MNCSHMPAAAAAIALHCKVLSLLIQLYLKSLSVRLFVCLFAYVCGVWRYRLLVELMLGNCLDTPGKKLRLFVGNAFAFCWH